jgi:glucose/arabinose dehydrogenase
MSMVLRMVLIAVMIVVAGCESARVRRADPPLPPVTSDELHNLRFPAYGPHVDTSGYFYDPTDKSCGGFPRLKVETAPGTCMGLVMPKERAIDPIAKKSFSMPRTLAQIPGSSDFLVVDLGSWHPGRGSIFRMSLVSGAYNLTLLKTGLDFPHAVKVGPDGKFWVGELKQISRFTLDASGIVGWETVVSGLPAFIDDSHPLSQFAFDPRNGDLYVNSGAPSDHCFVKDGSPSGLCPEVQGNELSGIMKIPWASLVRPPSGGVTKWTSIAQGLRNSMAIAISPAGVLIQGENARDFSDVDEPYEEMNVIQLDGVQRFHYGWPYCYDFSATSPDWENSALKCNASVVPTRAGDYQAPYVLIPPHAAPLAASYYHGKMFPALEGRLLMAWHGYRPTGHRVVSYEVDATGRPVLGRQNMIANYKFDRKEDACPVVKKMDPREGLVRYAPYTELITRWNERAGLRPRGAPASLTVADDGAIWISEDKNQTIVRLARDPASFVKEKCDPNADDRMELLAWRSAVSESPQLMADLSSLQTRLVTKYCASCHDGGIDKSVTNDSMSGLDFLVKSQWFLPQNPLRSKGLQAIQHAGTTPPMPLSGSPQFFGTAEGDEITKLVETWISEIPKDVDSRYAHTILQAARKIRATPSLTGTLCGNIPAGATAYIDPRTSTFVRADGWIWARIYLPPDHAALSSNACAWPKDGVFYVATQSL